MPTMRILVEGSEIFSTNEEYPRVRFLKNGVWVDEDTHEVTEKQDNLNESMLEFA